MTTLLKFFDNESKWTKDFHAKNIHGNSCTPTNPNAVCWCIQGALIKIHGPDNYIVYWSKLKDLIRFKYPNYARFANPVIRFNDDVTFVELKELLVEAAKEGV